MAANLAKPMEAVEGGEAQEGFQPLSKLRRKRKVSTKLRWTNLEGQVLWTIATRSTRDYHQMWRRGALLCLLQCYPQQPQIQVL